MAERSIVYLGVVKAGETGDVLFDPPLRAPFEPRVLSFNNVVRLGAVTPTRATVINTSAFESHFTLVITTPIMRLAGAAAQAGGRALWRALAARLLPPAK